jgi:adenosylcobinamide kinase/adenosylcobinamide-phosphate guanylyltransferase
MYTFVIGGHRSGRSNYALRRAAELGPPPWLYVTGGEETDEAIRKRIERTRRDQEAIWRTSVMPGDLTTLLDPEGVKEYGAIVLDGFAGWLTARADRNRAAADTALHEEVGALADRLYRVTTPVVLVSLEVGLAPLPADPAQLRHVRLLTSANQILATNAGSVVLMVAGVPMRVR